MTYCKSGLVFDNTYARELEGMYVPWTGDKVPAPRIVQFNGALAADLGLDPEVLNAPEGAEMLCGSVVPKAATPLAQAYAGHQFGGFSPQLGDGRAILLGELIDKNGARCDLHLKGSGRTPFSRGGDGKAVLGPVLREYLMGEAMHALGVPTTRALAAVETGEEIYRDGLKPGAVLARVASSHIRIGTFQFFAARQDHDGLKRLADYTIARHDPDLIGTHAPYLGLLEAVIERQARLVAKWVSLGFVHGVMNTDNVTISGETIDYGPCAFIDTYDRLTVFSSIDQTGRYAFGNQSNVMRWNLARFAEALLPLIDPRDTENAIKRADTALGTFDELYAASWVEEMMLKIGLKDHDDIDMVNKLMVAMEGQNVDYTCFFRALGEALDGSDDIVTKLFTDPTLIVEWLAKWRAVIATKSVVKLNHRKDMEAANPIYIPRNHLVEDALQHAETGDFVQFEELLCVVRSPFQYRPDRARYAVGSPEGSAPYKTFCGT